MSQELRCEGLRESYTPRDRGGGRGRERSSSGKFLKVAQTRSHVTSSIVHPNSILRDLIYDGVRVLHENTRATGKYQHVFEVLELY